MTIRLERMIPLPMLEQATSGSGIWEAGSVDFEKGNFYIIRAPSGRGKTSLLSVIYGTRKDYRGEVYLDEENIATFTARQWSDTRKRRLSFIFQGLELFDGLTAMENILLKNNITGFRSDAEIRTMAGRLGIEQFLHRKAGILSFGQQQRVAIIRALCQPFEYLLADECFSHMDRENTRHAFGLIREVCRQQGAGLILTSLNGSEPMDFDRQLEL